MPMFRTSRHIERQIDEFLDAVNEGALVFRDAVDAYLAGRQQDFQSKREVLEALEPMLGTLDQRHTDEAAAAEEQGGSGKAVKERRARKKDETVTEPSVADQP